MKIYKTRYQARKAALVSNTIDLVVTVKVDAGNGSYGYILMDTMSYKKWRKQK